jgi:hypothetical protein
MKPMKGAGCPYPVQTTHFGVVAVTVNPHLVYVVTEAPDAPASSKPRVGQGVSAPGGALSRRKGGIDAEEGELPQAHSPRQTVDANGSRILIAVSSH